MNKQYMIYEAAYASKPEIVNRDGEVLTFVTVLQEYNVRNRNGRIYPLELGKSMIQNELVLDKMRRRQLYVEDQHPLATSGPSGSIARQMRIEPSNSVALILDMWFEGNLLKGKLETTCNQKGRDFRDMILFNGIIPAFSLRANGSTKRNANGDIIVQEPIQMVTYDYVVTPSHIPAVMEKITGVEDRSERLHASLLDMPSMMHESMLTESPMEHMQMIMESAELMYDEGIIAPIEKPIRDVRKGSTQLKKLSEAYIYQAGDKIKENTSSGVLVESADGDLTQMFAEEFVIKDIRHKILSETILVEKLDTDKFLERLGIRAANKYGPGGSIWAAVFAKSVTGKDSTAKPKDAVQRKFYDELLAAVKRDAGIQHKIIELKKAVSSDNYDKELVRSLKKEVKGSIQQLAKDLRVNQKTAMNEAEDSDYLKFMDALNESFVIDNHDFLNENSDIINDIVRELKNGTLTEEILDELFFLKFRAKRARKKAEKLAKKAAAAEEKAQELEKKINEDAESIVPTSLEEAYMTEVINAVEDELNKSDMLEESCMEIWQPLKAYMGFHELKPRRRINEAITEIAAAPNAGVTNPIPVKDIETKNKTTDAEDEEEKKLGLEAQKEIAEE